MASPRYYRLSNGNCEIVISLASCWYFSYQGCFNREVGVPLKAIFICSRFLFTASSIHNEPPPPLLPSSSSPVFPSASSFNFVIVLSACSLSLSVLPLCLSFTSCPFHSAGVLRIAALSHALLIHLGLQYWLDYYSAYPLWEKPVNNAVFHKEMTASTPKKNKQPDTRINDGKVVTLLWLELEGEEWPFVIHPPPPGVVCVASSAPCWLSTDGLWCHWGLAFPAEWIQGRDSLTLMQHVSIGRCRKELLRPRLHVAGYSQKQIYVFKNNSAHTKSLKK